MYLENGLDNAIIVPELLFLDLNFDAFALKFCNQAVHLRYVDRESQALLGQHLRATAALALAFLLNQRP